VECEIPDPAQKIWRALTQPHLIEERLMKNDFKPVTAAASIFAQTGSYRLSDPGRRAESIADVK